jgi:cytoskeletal protein RodZ
MRTDIEPLRNGVKTHLNLAGARNEKDITLEEIVRSTRIARHFLEAIEAENFGHLPGGVYNTSYIRQYAKATGYDEAALLEHYHSKIELPEVAEAAPVPSRFRIDEALRHFLQNVSARRRSQHAA